MKAETLVALKKSIEHWERLSSGKANKGEGITSSHCALCQIFLTPENENYNDCEGCPVSEKSGSRLCKDTPWVEANKAFNFNGYRTDSQAFRDAAKKELEFLKSLLPPTE